MEILEPRSLFSSVLLNLRISSPLNNTSPSSNERPGAISFRIALVITDFPDPLSPTMHKTSPLRTFILAFSTANFRSAFFGKPTDRLFISKMWFGFAIIVYPKVFQTNMLGKPGSLIKTNFSINTSYLQ